MKTIATISFFIIFLFANADAEVIKFDNTGKYLAYQDESGIVVYNAKTHTIVNTFEVSNVVDFVVFDGSLYWVNEEKSKTDEKFKYNRKDVETRKTIYASTFSSNAEGSEKITTWLGALSPTGKYFAQLFTDNEIAIYNFKDKKMLPSIRFSDFGYHEIENPQMIFDEMDSNLVVKFKNAQMLVYDLQKCCLKSFITLTLRPAPYGSLLAITPNAEKIIVVKDNSIEAYKNIDKLFNFKEATSFDNDENLKNVFVNYAASTVVDVKAMDNEHFITLDKKGTFVNWNINTGDKKSIIIPQENDYKDTTYIGALYKRHAFDYKDSVIAYLTDDRSVTFFDLRTSKSVTKEDIRVKSTPDIVLQTNNGYSGSCAYSPDGKYLATGATSLLVWDLKSNQILYNVRGYKGLFIDYVEYSQDGRYIITKDQGGNIKIVDVATMKIIDSYEGDAVCMSANNKWLIILRSATSKKILIDIYNFETKKLIKTIEHKGTLLMNHHLSISNSNEVILLSGLMTAYIWDVLALNENKVLFTKFKSLNVNDAFLSKKIDLLVASTKDRLLFFGQQTHTDRCVSPQIHYARDLFVSDKGKYVAGRNCLNEYLTDSTLTVYERNTGRLVFKFKEDNPIYASAYTISPDEKYIAILANGIQIFELETGAKVKELGTKLTPYVYSFQKIAGDTLFAFKSRRKTEALNISSWKLSDFDYHKTKPLLFKSDNDTADRLNIKIDSLKNPKLHLFAKTHKSRISLFEYSFVQKDTIVCYRDSMIYGFDLKHDRVFLSHRQKMVYNFEYSPDLKKIAFTHDSITNLHSAVKVMSVDGSSIKNINHKIKVVLKLTFSHDGRFLLLGDGEGHVSLCDSRKGAEIYHIQAHDPQWLNGEVRGMVFSSDDSHFYTCSNDRTIKAWETKSGRLLKTFKGHNSNVIGISFLSNNRLISAGEDGEIKIWNLRTAATIATAIIDEDGNKLVMTPDGYYYAEKSALENIAFRRGSNAYPASQFDIQYNRPDIVFQRLGFLDTETIDIYKLAYLKRLKKSGFTEKMFTSNFHIPVIEIVDRAKLPMNTSSEKFTFHFKASDSRVKLNRINVLVNNIPVFGQNGIHLKKGLEVLDDSITIELTKGRNRIQISAVNENAHESLRETFEIQFDDKRIAKPKLYFVALSASKFEQSENNLKYAVKDGRDLATLFGCNQNSQYEKVFIDTLFDQAVVKESLPNIKKKLLNSKPNDQVIVFASGHGMLSQNQDFYFASYNNDFSNPEKNGIGYELLENLLDSIPARNKLLLIDACQSGNVDKDLKILASKDSISTDTKGGSIVLTYGFRTTKPQRQNPFELMQELFFNQTTGSGATAISAATGAQPAHEHDRWNNGLFTYCLIKGLKNKDADKNKDGSIKVSELRNYLIEEVQKEAKLAKMYQKPTSRSEINADFEIWKTK